LISHADGGIGAVGVGTLAGTLGFSKRGIMNGPDGKPIHAELMLRGTTLMLGPENPALGKRSATTVGASPAGLFLCSHVDGGICEQGNPRKHDQPGAGGNADSGGTVWAKTRRR
jgi:hypothetical protein